MPVVTLTWACVGFGIIWEVLSVNHDPITVAGVLGGMLFGGGMMYGMFGNH